VVVRLAHSRRGHTETVKAGVVPGELVLDRGKVQEIAVYDLAELVVALARGPATDGKNLLHLGVEQALAQGPLPDHAGGPEEEDPHGNTLDEKRGNVSG
jgi:hypothetical protein